MDDVADVFKGVMEDLAGVSRRLRGLGERGAGPDPYLTPRHYVLANASALAVVARVCGGGHAVFRMADVEMRRHGLDSPRLAEVLAGLVLALRAELTAGRVSEWRARERAGLLELQLSQVAGDRALGRPRAAAVVAGGVLITQLRLLGVLHHVESGAGVEPPGELVRGLAAAGVLDAEAAGMLGACLEVFEDAARGAPMASAGEVVVMVDQVKSFIVSSPA